MARRRILEGAYLGAKDFLASESQRSPFASGDRQDCLYEALKAGRVISFEWDPAPDVVVRSLNADEILGREATRDAGRSFFEGVHTEDRERLSCLIGSLTPEKPEYTAAYHYVRASDGKEVILEDTGRAEFDPSRKVVGGAEFYFLQHE
jgi:hypothetical protein